MHHILILLPIIKARTMAYSQLPSLKTNLESATSHRPDWRSQAYWFDPCRVAPFTCVVQLLPKPIQHESSRSSIWYKIHGFKGDSPLSILFREDHCQFLYWLRRSYFFEIDCRIQEHEKDSFQKRHSSVINYNLLTGNCEKKAIDRRWSAKEKSNLCSLCKMRSISIKIIQLHVEL